MGRDLLGKDELASDLIRVASGETGEDIGRLCAKGPARKLARTELLQPALTAVCLGLWNRLRDAGLEPGVTAGHSVGEIPALAAAGAMDPADAVRLAAARGKAMGAAAAERTGGMTAITGMPVEDVMGRVGALEGEGEGEVAAAAVNAPSQLTVSGDPEALEGFTGTLKGADGVKITGLRVSGAWHSEHMRPAVEPFASALEEAGIGAPAVPMVFNRDASSPDDPARIRELLAGQLVSPVRWDLVMTRLVEMGVTDFVEIGPGKVIRGLIRLNTPDPAVRVHSVADLRSLDRTVAALC